MDGRSLVAIVVGIGLAWLGLLLVLWVLRPRDVGLAELLRVIPDVLRLVRDLLRDRGSPVGVRLALLLLLAWLISPIDLIPEFIPVLGPADDVVMAILALRYVRRRLGTESLRRRWRGTPDGFRLLSAAIGA